MTFENFFHFFFRATFETLKNFSDHAYQLIVRFNKLTIKPFTNLRILKMTLCLSGMTSFRYTNGLVFATLWQKKSVRGI